MHTHPYSAEASSRLTKSGKSPVPLIVFASAATVTAAATGIAAYLYLQRRSMSTPQHLLSRCRTAIDQLEKSIEAAHA